MVTKIIELVDKCEKYRVQQEYKVDQILGRVGVKVLRTPTKYCELNPIELIWANLKNKVALKNTSTTNIDGIKILVGKAFSEITYPFDIKKMNDKINCHKEMTENVRLKLEVNII